MKDTGSSEHNPMPNQPPPDNGLDSLGSVDFLLINIRPERDSLTPRMRPAERMPYEGSGAALIGRPLSAHSCTDHLLLSIQKLALKTDRGSASQVLSYHNQDVYLCDRLCLYS